MGAALTECELSRDLFRRVAGRDGSTADDRLQAAVAEIKLGDLLGNPNFPNLGRRSEAALLYESALSALRTEHQVKPAGQQLRRYLGIALERIGTLHEGGRWDAAALAYGESFAIRQGLAAGAPLPGRHPARRSGRLRKDRQRAALQR